MILPINTSAEDFAKWVVENKPYLIEIEEEIQKMGNYGEMEVVISVRGGRVDKVSFWKGRIWLREKSLTHSPNSSKR